MTRSPAEPKPIPVRRYRYSKLKWRILVRALDAAGSLGMRLWRKFRPAPRVETPRRILVVQLDHLGDAVLSSPLLAGLRMAYPEATIDVLASPSNVEVFQADPNVDHVRLAARNWFARRRSHWALGTAVWELGSRLRGAGYDLGIDVRGDVLSVLVLALAGIPRRVGWAMGGGGFLLTDIAEWVPGRHEVASRLALLAKLGISDDEPARVVVHSTDHDRVLIGQWLRDDWPERAPEVMSQSSATRTRGERHAGGRLKTLTAVSEPAIWSDEGDWLHAGRFGAEAPLLAVHLGAGMAAKRWPAEHWQELLTRFLDDGWRVILVGGSEDTRVAEGMVPHANLRDWTGRLTVPQTAAFLERADLFVGSDSGPAHLAACAGIASVILFSGTNRPGQWRPWSRRSLVLRHKVPCRPCHQKICPLADHPCMAGLLPERVYREAKRWWARMHREESPHAPI
ncbi:glycosyltransferase family 9 protein [Singulisphaera sp. Ch08]|uniref:Glycosyltransferase family 9 protein n=1 Tax=Singulisphaera sp. Ch08 TaxID=3120278 RepID=A0AAU7CC86_9BACT